MFVRDWLWNKSIYHDIPQIMAMYTRTIIVILGLVDSSTKQFLWARLPLKNTNVVDNIRARHCEQIPGKCNANDLDTVKHCSFKHEWFQINLKITSQFGKMNSRKPFRCVQIILESMTCQANEMRNIFKSVWKFYNTLEKEIRKTKKNQNMYFETWNRWTGFCLSWQNKISYLTQ